MLSEEDISFVSKVIDDEKIYLQNISQQIWENPELKFEEVFAHDLLTEALEKYGFTVQKHHLLPTAFRGEFSFEKENGKNGPTIAILCEYDALPNIGHACGHNLIAESGIAAGIAVKTAMEIQSSVRGKVVVLGTPAEEGGGGKIKLLENGAFNDIDVALMVHPGLANEGYPNMVSVTKVVVTYIGEEKHSFDHSCKIKNALDAAIMCYTNIVHLKQHIKPSCKINGIILKGGVSPYVIPAETQLEFWIRAPTTAELKLLKERAVSCFDSAAVITGCKVVKEFRLNEHKNIISNRILTNLYIEYAEHFGLKFNKQASKLYGPVGSSDMGNVTHVIPGFHPFYGIGNCFNHTKEFTNQAATDEAQIATFAASKAMALVAITLMKYPETLKNVQRSFKEDILKDLNYY